MNINLKYMRKFTGNQSILDKKKENTSKVSFLKENIKGTIVNLSKNYSPTKGTL